MDRQAALSFARLALACFALGWAAAAGAAPEPDRNAALHALFEREFLNLVEEAPELGSYFGLDGYDDRVTDLAPEAIARRNARIDRVKAEIERFDPAKLNRQDRISREVFLERVQRSLRERSFYPGLPFGPSDGWMRVSSQGGPQFTLPFIVRATRFRGPADYENYLKRLDAVPRVLSQVTDLMSVGMRAGWMPPAAAMTKVAARSRSECIRPSPRSSGSWSRSTSPPAATSSAPPRCLADPLTTRTSCARRRPPRSTPKRCTRWA